MKAIVQREYGAPQDVLALEDVDEPAVGDGEVLVRVRATSVNPADWHMIRGEPRIARLSFGLRAPNAAVVGCDVAGVVEAVGANVTTLRPGDEVFGCPFMRGFGTFAEKARVADDVLALKPANLAFDQAAAVPMAASTALQAVRDHGRVEPGTTVLIIGAAGGVGTFAVQIAKSLGAEVTGVCSTRNLGLVRSLGANAVIDYTQEDLDQGRRYDVVLQLAGTRSPSDCRRLLTPKGTLVAISGDSTGRWIGPIVRVIKARAMSLFVRQTLTSFTIRPNREDMQSLKAFVEAGDVSPVIDRSYRLAEVPEAIAYLEDGHARGKVVVSVA